LRAFSVLKKIVFVNFAKKTKTKKNTNFTVFGGRDSSFLFSILYLKPLSDNLLFQTQIVKETINGNFSSLKTGNLL